MTKDEHAMAVEKVRHAGDLVACVAAIDEATAREAERLIQVEYELIDPVHDMREGLEDSGNPYMTGGLPHGESNVQRGFQEFGDIEGMMKTLLLAKKIGFLPELTTFTEPHAVVAHWV